MTRATPLAAGSFLTHSSNPTHTSNRTHTSGHSVSPGFEDYGYDGLPGNPMLAAGLYETRMAVLAGAEPPVLGGPQDLGAARDWAGLPSRLPLQEDPDALFQAAAKPRWGTLMFELLSGSGFACAPQAHGGSATLSLDSGDPAAPLTITMSRPPRACFEAQLPRVVAQVSVRDRRYTEVLTQVGPPLAYYGAVVGLQTERHRRTLELIALALDFAYPIVMRFKHALACPRPSAYSSVVQPMIEVPGHASLPAGHATEGHIVATLLSALVPGAAVREPLRHLRRVAARIADNRIVAGLHFPVDNVAGQLLGDALAQYLLARCGAPNAASSVQFNGADPQLAQAGPVDADAALFAVPGCSVVKAVAVQVNDLLYPLWRQAEAEWH